MTGQALIVILYHFKEGRRGLIESANSSFSSFVYRPSRFSEFSLCSIDDQLCGGMRAGILG